MDSRTLISPGMLLAVLIVTLFSNDFLTTPLDAARYAGSSGYWTVLLAFIFALPFVWLILAFQRRFPGENLMITAKRTLGKPAACIGNMLYLLAFLAWVVFALRDASNLVLAYLLNRTSLWAVLLVFLLTITYIASKGLSGVTRMAAFVLIPILVFRVGMKLLSYQGVEWSHLLPLFAAPPLDYLRGGLALCGSYLPLGAVLLFYNRQSNPEKMGLVMHAAVGSTLIVLLIGTVGTIGAFGADYTQQLNWPNLVQVHNISIPFLVLEQVGVLFIIVWLTMFIIGMGLYLNIVAEGIQSQFKLGYQWVLPGLAVVTLATGLVLHDAPYTAMIFGFIRHWAIAVVAGYAVLVYLVAMFRGIRGSMHAA